MSANRDTENRGENTGSERSNQAHAPAAVNRRRLLIYGGASLLIGIALYFSLPRLAGLKRSWEILRDVDPLWVIAAVILTVAMFACYVLLFGSVIGGRCIRGASRLTWMTSYEACMASLGVTTIVTAGGAGGIAFSIWVLYTAGLSLIRAARRVTAFLIFLYSIYLSALIIAGVLLWAGVNGNDVSVALTLLPALIAAIIVVGFLVLTLLLKGHVHIRAKHRRGRWWRWFRNAPQLLADSTLLAIEILRDRRGGPPAMLFAIGYWAFNVAVLWVLYRGFGVSVAPLVLIQGFFIGMTASLIPLLPGGIGSIDAGLIGAFIAFGLPGTETVLAVLSYRMVTFWLPTIPELFAYISLQGKINRHAESLQLR